MSEVYRSYTPAEKRKRAWLILRGVKQAAADAVDPKIERQIDAIDDAAEERGRLEAAALHRQNEKAKAELATAKAAVRAASREDRAAARTALTKAEQRARATEKAIRSAGL
ncbi:hypothetical protein [Streptomyces iranensis]|uniref:Uncharacterized protein n=1 Tax=Streptomyces iranensis TaxID=576784 RepID=A0A060ZNA9_9ACTN|nr:hypothetical protein [Streptomyces iranensis]MBP2062464.1 hypothetical protein [Streptomyces iranensis]CDR07326.1 predicted protein [Streptomyces iranensis]